MSHNSVASLDSGKGRTRRERCLGPSQVAKDLAYFEIWSAYQNCEEVDLSSDLPSEMRRHVNDVFRLTRRLPQTWTDKKSKVHRGFARVSDPEFADFLDSAHRSAPDLFSDDVRHDEEARCILHGLHTVFTAWKSAGMMRESSHKFSETEYAMKVLVRTAAVRHSLQRVQHAISLPQPSSTHKISTEAVRVLNAKVAKPDGALFIPTHCLTDLCESEQSAYKILCRSLKRRSGTVGGESSFRYQSTLCAKLPEARVFEFAGTFWEDKKPSQDELHAAYRQNRMATTSALRQLHALNVQAPVFGLVWAEGKVRAHVDWWQLKNGEVMIYSAPYGGPPFKGRRKRSSAFHEWDLAKPADIISVYLLMTNLDRWTTGAFCDAVVAGTSELARRVHAGQTVVPWRRSGDLARMVNRKVVHPEPTSAASTSTSTAPPSVKRKVKKRKPRTSSS
ncbi:hypothetical protein PYCCODRAFT_1466922 [Trametes coccinea BRFM310]|uniref:Uncharacterized protein n=1 Tax=Trametes coccinea (strain BRFM310) TaxID=1353009 RepID=A0A1Y2IQY7_TRAC3|nr:hypothetical protein PYCCODRAFT_1466922 [Trametes coccinea BRFM310]